jgi:two-component system phosphate regulon sensor histidine kinase PhoR
MISLPTVLALLVGLVLIEDKNQKVSQERFEKLLHTSWRLTKLAYDLDGSDDLAAEKSQRLMVAMTREIEFRVTLMDSQGRVLFDSVEPGELESHQDRPEFKAALIGKPNFFTRKSDSTGRKTMYYAQKMADNVILRVSSPLEYFDQQRELYFRGALWSVGILVLVVLLFSLGASRRLAQVYRRLSRAVEAAKKGERDLPTFKSLELDEALFSLSEACRDLKEKNRQIGLLNGRLEYILSKINEGVIFLDGQRIVYRNQRAEEILSCPIPDSTTKIVKKEILSVFATVKNSQLNHLRIGEKIIFFDQARQDDQLLVIFHDMTEKEKYSSYKSDLVGNVSHELKTPLALVLGAAEVILKDPAMTRPFLEKFLNTLYRNAQRLNSLLDDLIRLHELESRPEALAEEGDLAEIIEEIEEMIDPGDKEVIWAYDRVKIYFHSAHVISVITNLVNNGLKYSKGPKIIVEVRLKDNFLEIDVADSGPIIPDSERERIFERFYSLSRSRNRDRSGSGLGLAIVKHIARIYRGQVKVTENEMGGNTFSVLLTSPINL